ncbi:MAG: UDP-N-acetyl-D-mannosamine dehydrogenase [Candidatus Marinimicrobia bacterium]|nr:UDP-N-acetyl-D-mannosamine dehydrogenase [Candidatus Neomarinimicrobiota bacterium]|tara:strand:+ start:6543 stop:7745 length:1203 start_codon:yes stop_codon:yes gene_type:complete
MFKNKTISIIGLGYVGLPTALIVANAGYKVFGYDKDTEIITELNNHKLRILENGFEDFFKSVVKKNKISFKNNLEKSDVYIIAVPTPIYKDKTPDLSYIESACEEIIPLLKKNDTIILESTSPIGTTKNILQQIKSKRKDLFNKKQLPCFSLAYCPERVLPGNLVDEILNNDRIVGGINEESSKSIKKFYQSFTSGNVFDTNSQTAELVKLTENAFRDVNIAFANELSMLCENKDINVLDAIELANKHPRVNILNPGIGVGGHCIPVDPWFIVHSSKKYSSLIKRSREINNEKTKWVLEKIIQIIDKLSESNKEIKIGILGITYKPNINDIRESPSYKIALSLKEKYNSLSVSDEYVYPKPKDLNCISKDRLIIESDIIFILTKHTEYKNINSSKVIDFS